MELESTNAIRIMTHRHHMPLKWALMVKPAGMLLPTSGDNAPPAAGLLIRQTSPDRHFNAGGFTVKNFARLTDIPPIASTIA